MPRVLRIPIYWKLTALYVGLFLTAGAVLLTVNYSLLSAQLPQNSAVHVVPLGNSSAAPSREATAAQGPIPPGTNYIDLDQFADGISRSTSAAYRQAVLSKMVTESLITLGLAAVLGVGGGLLFARRALRPVHTMTIAARRLGEASLDERLVLRGAHDELWELGETFNAMLERLDRAFQRERQLIANISHELRTPLATQRIALEVGLGDLVATGTDLRRLGDRALAQNIRASELIERLLLLASVEQAAIVHDEVVDLVDAVHQALQAVQDAGRSVCASEVALALDLDPALVVGDRLLLERLVGNLIENALKYNQPGGWVRVSTACAITGVGERVRVRVSNSGPQVPPHLVPTLFEPFRRQRGERIGSGGGFGLGLAIVEAIAARHAGTVDAQPGEEGGLIVTVTLPSASASASSRSGTGHGTEQVFRHDGVA